jgi:hypothetical protein
MSWQQSDLDAIDEAIATGAREVQYADKKVTYNSLSDLLRAKGLIETALAGRPAGSQRVVGVYYKNQ